MMMTIEEYTKRNEKSDGVCVSQASTQQCTCKKYKLYIFFK